MSNARWVQMENVSGCKLSCGGASWRLHWEGELNLAKVLQRHPDFNHLSNTVAKTMAAKLRDADPYAA